MAWIGIFGSPGRLRKDLGLSVLVHVLLSIFHFLPPSMMGLPEDARGHKPAAANRNH